jgi:microcystin-dependent protein
MAQPYVGEIRMVGFNFAPAGWASCDGQLLPISENETLFQLIGTTYGGDGQSTFALPNLQSRIPIHQGNGFILAETGGVETVTLTVQQLPAHAHPLLVTSNPAIEVVPLPGHTLASTSEARYASAQNTVMNPGSIGIAGGSQPHENMQPYLAVHFIISLFGIFPSPT